MAEVKAVPAVDEEAGLLEILARFDDAEEGEEWNRDGDDPEWEDEDDWDDEDDEDDWDDEDEWEEEDEWEDDEVDDADE